MLDKLRANQKLMDAIEDLAQLGRKSFNDLNDGEQSDTAELCCQALSESHLAEIVIENIDNTKMHVCIAEFLRAKDTLNVDCALIQLKCEALKFSVSHFEDSIDELLKEKYDSFHRENVRFNHAWDVEVIGRNPLYSIQGVSTL